MIKANEYRIGNWVSNGEVEFQLTSKDIYHLDIYVNRVIANPIPITPEWLERMGFEKQTDWSYYFDDIYFSYNETGDLTCRLRYYKTICYYVHQIQNLYFALTGEEITVKDGD